VAVAMVLERGLALSSISFKIRMHYVPKGPIFDKSVDVAQLTQIEKDLVRFSKSRKAFVLNMDPEVLMGKGVPDTESEEKSAFGEMFVSFLKKQGWFFAPSQPQFKNSIFIDLTPDEDALLSAMKQKTRYNVRLASKKGVVVRVGTVDDFEMLAKMYAITAQRDNFAIRDLAYYIRVWTIFFEKGMLKPLIAEVDGEAVAGLMLFVFGKMSWYIYGMSNGDHRNKMPTYLLQWEAMRISKELGCEIYDLWGAPDEFCEEDRMWGVYRFKEGLGGYVVRHVGNWELPLRPLIYFLYQKLVPFILKVMRSFGNKRTQKELVE
jgi:lipid II:glycine glycyltransferase (peptidoglycan interpeptide bridge formation enzyme)